MAEVKLIHEDFESLLLEMDAPGYLCELKSREEVLKDLEKEETEPPRAGVNWPCRCMHCSAIETEIEFLEQFLLKGIACIALHPIWTEGS